MSDRERAAAAGMVFQFPERHFLGDSLMNELTFCWPQRPQDCCTRQQLSVRLTHVSFAPMHSSHAATAAGITAVMIPDELLAFAHAVRHGSLPCYIWHSFARLSRCPFCLL